jgi:hypothetical protein
VVVVLEADGIRFYCSLPMLTKRRLENCARIVAAATGLLTLIMVED